MKEAQRTHCASHEADDSREKGESPAHWLEDGIKEPRYRDAAGGRRFGSQQTQPATNEEGGYSRGEAEQVQDTRDPGLQAWRRFRDPFRHYCGEHICSLDPKSTRLNSSH